MLIKQTRYAVIFFLLTCTLALPAQADVSQGLGKPVAPVVQESSKASTLFAFEVNSGNRQHSKVKTLMLLVQSDENKLLADVAQSMHFDLEFSDQLAIDLKRATTVPDQKQLASIAKQGYTLVLTLEQRKPTTHSIDLAINLVDPASSQSFFHKKVTCKDRGIIHQAHVIADELMPVLTGEKGPQLSTLAYCKQLSNRHKIVCVADYACRIEKPVVTASTINVAPAWHTKAAGLCYSQFTRSNSRLMFLDFKTMQHKIVCSYDGLNMQPSFSPDGSKAALCLSSKGNSEIYLYDQNLCKKMGKRVFKQMTENHGSNVSPCLLKNDNLIFCSDFQTGSPQIYFRDGTSRTVKRLTSGAGYCASPAHCATTNKLVYTRYVKGTFQLFTLDMGAAQPRERQLTFNAGDKIEPTWSACGKYVAFTYAHFDTKLKRRSNQIAVLNTSSGVIRVLTSGIEQKSFPTWTERNLYA